VRSNAVDWWSSFLAALTPRAEIEGEWANAHMGLQARLMSQALRKLTAAISKSKSCVVFINQVRIEDRRYVRQSGNQHRRPGLEILRVGAHRSAQKIESIQVRRRHHRPIALGPKWSRTRWPRRFKEGEFEIYFDEAFPEPRISWI